mmetsp:Transcript_34229/g.102232  ORF Transcript_34229/g.102232 Transcript_34229/m.102232 type:complete len:251 (+) Transcript_34229:556-1308(+)
MKRTERSRGRRRPRSVLHLRRGGQTRCRRRLSCCRTLQPASPRSATSAPPLPTRARPQRWRRGGRSHGAGQGLRRGSSTTPPGRRRWRPARRLWSWSRRATTWLRCSRTQHSWRVRAWTKRTRRRRGATKRCELARWGWLWPCTRWPLPDYPHWQPPPTSRSVSRTSTRCSAPSSTRTGRPRSRASAAGASRPQTGGTQLPPARVSPMPAASWGSHSSARDCTRRPTRNSPGLCSWSRTTGARRRAGARA